MNGSPRTLGLATAVALLAGCAQGPGTPTGSPTAGVAASPSPSPARSVFPIGALPCRMPANLRVDQGGFREVLGYIVLPPGATKDDPTDAIVKVADFPVGGGTAPIWGTTTSPQLFGVALGTRSSTANKWLPAPPERVAPDGRHYAYLHPDGNLRIAAADGSEVPVPNPNGLAPLAYTAAGVVLVQNGPASNGLWLLDPATKSTTVITPPAGTDDWREVSGDAVFGVNSPGVLGAPPPTQVLMVGLVGAGQPRIVYTAAAGSSIAFIAADRPGGVLIGVTGAAPGLVYLSAGVGALSVTVPSGVVVATIGPRHHADGYGIWFLGRSGVFLFNPDSGFHQIAPGTTTDVAPGGDCVYPD